MKETNKELIHRMALNAASIIAYSEEMKSKAIDTLRMLNEIKARKGKGKEFLHYENSRN